MPLYLGGQYEARGGDDKLRERYAQLTEWAREDGVLDNARKSVIPDVVKGAFSRLTDFFAREEYAVAGAWEVLLGKADKGDTVGGRVVREFLGGTKLGNLFGVEDRREKEGFSEILEQAGVGEGGRLSDLIGENTVTKYFDPTVRGTAALGMSIFLTPTTWLTLGRAGAAKFVGRAGIIAATSKANRLADVVYKRNITRAARRFGLADDLAESSPKWAEIEGRVIAREAEERGLQGLAEIGFGEMRTRLQAEAAGRVADISMRHGGLFGGLAERSAVRFGSTQWLGGQFRGVPIMDLATLGRPGKALAEAMRQNRVTRPLIGAADSVMDVLDTTFNRVPRNLRIMGAFRSADELRQSLRSSSIDIANENMRFISKRARNALAGDREASKALMKHLDNPSIHSFESALEQAKRIGIDEDELRGIVDGWRSRSASMAQGAMKLGLLDPVQVEKYQDRYISHVLDLPEAEAAEFYRRYFSKSFDGGSMGRYARMRTADSYDELEEVLRQAGYDPDKVIVWNPAKVMTDYQITHINAIADANFTNDVLAGLSLDYTKIFRELAKDIPGFRPAVAASRDELESVFEILQRSSTFAGSEAKERIAALAKTLTEGSSEIQAIRRLEAELVELSGGIEKASLEKFRREARADIVRTQRARRGEEITELIQERSGVISEMKEVRRLRNLAKSRIRDISRSEIENLGIPKIRSEIKQIKKSLAKIRGRKDADVFKTSRLSEQISDNLLVIKRLEGALDDMLEAPRANLDQAVRALDDLDQMRRGINDDLEFWRTSRLLAEEELDEALTVLDQAKSQVRGLKGEAAAARRVISGLRKQARMDNKILHPRDVKKMDIAKLKDMRPELRGHFLYEVTARANNLRHMESIIRKYDEIIDSISPDALAKIRKAGLSRRLEFSSGDITEYTFRHGPMKGKSRLLPKSVADHFDEMGADLRMGLTPQQEKWLKLFDFTQNTFKRTHTGLFIPFHVRNAISNLAAVAVETGLLPLLDPRRAWRVAKTLTNSSDEWTHVAQNGARYTSQQYRGIAHANNIMPQRLRIAELTGDETELLAKIPVISKIDEVAGKFGQGLENTFRMMYMDVLLSRGHHPMDAARKVKRVLFDYGDLSKTEREFFRRVFPFYTWTRKNVELQARNLLTKPGAVGAQIKALNAGDRGPSADYLPDFMRGEMKIALTDQPGKAGTFISGIDLPINNIDVLWAGGVGKTLREQFSMFTPLLKAPLELALNLDTFTMQPIKGRAWLGQMGPMIERSWPKQMREWVELDKIETADGRTLYKANGLKMYFLTKNLLIGRILNEGTRSIYSAKSFMDGDEREGAMALIKALSGMRFTEMELTEAQKAKLTREIRALEQFLLEEGSVAEFSRTFRPKQRQQQRVGLFSGLRQ